MRSIALRSPQVYSLVALIYQSFHGNIGEAYTNFTIKVPCLRFSPPHRWTLKRLVVAKQRHSDLTATMPSKLNPYYYEKIYLSGFYAVDRSLWWVCPTNGATLVCFVVQVTSPSRALVLFYDIYSDMKITYPHGLLVPVVSYELTSATRDVCR